jgi:hypothetical protein
MATSPKIDFFSPTLLFAKLVAISFKKRFFFLSLGAVFKKKSFLGYSKKSIFGLRLVRSKISATSVAQLCLFFSLASLHSLSGAKPLVEAKLGDPSRPGYRPLASLPIGNVAQPLPKGSTVKRSFFRNE